MPASQPAGCAELRRRRAVTASACCSQQTTWMQAGLETCCKHTMRHMHTCSKALVNVLTAPSLRDKLSASADLEDSCF